METVKVEATVTDEAITPSKCAWSEQMFLDYIMKELFLFAFPKESDCHDVMRACMVTKGTIKGADYKLYRLWDLDAYRFKSLEVYGTFYGEDRIFSFVPDVNYDRVWRTPYVVRAGGFQELWKLTRFGDPTKPELLDGVHVDTLSRGFESGALRNLDELCLNGCCSDPLQATSLQLVNLIDCMAKIKTSIRTLSLNSTPMGDDGMVALAHAASHGSFCHLEFLMVQRCNIGNFGITKFLDAASDFGYDEEPVMKNLSFVGLQSNVIDWSGVSYMTCKIKKYPRMLPELMYVKLAGQVGNQPLGGVRALEKLLSRRITTML